MNPPYLVQVRDADGFWCNVTELPTWKAACKTAQFEANESDKMHRVVQGPKREDAKLFLPSAREATR